MIHDINLMRSLAGRADEARFASVAQEGISLFLDFPQSAAAMHWVNLTDGVARYQQEFLLLLSRASRLARLSVALPARRAGPSWVLEGGSQESPRSWRTVETISFHRHSRRELLEFYACITENREPRTTAEDAVRERCVVPGDHPSAPDRHRNIRTRRFT